MVLGFLTSLATSIFGKYTVDQVKCFFENPECQFNPFQTAKPFFVARRIDYYKRMAQLSKMHQKQFEAQIKRQEQYRIEKQKKKEKIKNTVVKKFKKEWEFTLHQMEELKSAMEIGCRLGQCPQSEKEQWLFSRNYAQAASMIRKARMKAPAGTLHKSEYYLRAKELGLI